MQQNLGVSPVRRNTNSSFINKSGGSFIEQRMVQMESEEERKKRELKEMMDTFTILTKEEAKEEMARKDFDDFLSKSGRIMERALDQEFDIIGDFFIDDDN